MSDVVVERIAEIRSVHPLQRCELGGQLIDQVIDIGLQVVGQLARLLRLLDELVRLPSSLLDHLLRLRDGVGKGRARARHVGNERLDAVDDLRDHLRDLVDIGFEQLVQREEAEKLWRRILEELFRIGRHLCAPGNTRAP